jgi:hypothetical protein
MQTLILNRSRLKKATITKWILPSLKPKPIKYSSDSLEQKVIVGCESKKGWKKPISFNEKKVAWYHAMNVT